MTSELPVNQRRDTACPLTRVNETRKRVKRWPDIIGIGAPKCGTGTIAFFDCHSSIVFREAEGRAFTKSSTFRSVSVGSNFVRAEQNFNISKLAHRTKLNLFSNLNVYSRCVA